MLYALRNSFVLILSFYYKGGGNLQIIDQKLDFSSNTQSKVRSFQNIKHVPGGGDKKASSWLNKWLIYAWISKDHIESVISVEIEKVIHVLVLNDDCTMMQINSLSKT